ncbi:H+-transporting ATPase [Burkholderiales bacterium]|nr:H+-transporting ATPase [Burkholderiales bacterium]
MADDMTGRLRRAIDAPHAQSADAVAEALATDPAAGLTAAEAARRLAIAGANVLASAPPVPRWRRFLAQFESPLVLLLVAAGAVSYAVHLTGDDGGAPYEALTILAIVVANAILGFVQEQRAEAAVAGLRKLAGATAMVVRGGGRTTIDAAELVPGDLLVIEEGDAIPADARVVESVSLKVAEAALTGESAPVDKDTQALPRDTGLADRANMVHSGTSATFGHGLAIVTTTGMRSEIGRIAALLASAPLDDTPLQRELDRTGRVLGVVVIAIALVVAATLLAIYRDFSAAALTTILLYTVALAVSAVPEGLAAVTTIVLSLGTQRMAARNVIVRKLSAVETLGATSVICTDKTGTLTRNEMTVRAIVTASGRVDVDGAGYMPEGRLLAGGEPVAPGPLASEVEATIAAGTLTNNAALVRREGRWTIEGDPTEGALKVLSAKAGLESDIAARFPRLGELPFSADRKLMSTAHEDRDTPGCAVLFCKGAPDVLLARCTHERVGSAYVDLGDARRAEIAATIDALADDALRTLGFAAHVMDPADVDSLHAGHEQAFAWLGVMGMMDPPRDEARDAVATAHTAGVRVLMITGDHPRSALAIAREIGIAGKDDANAVTGAEIDRLDDAALREVAARRHVFARTSPEHKLRLVRALKDGGAIVAMTGDGVNDAPALRAADIGIAMGVTGTDVSKDAADMVLADDNFASIVAAIGEGRSIYANIRKFLRYLLATNLGEVLVLFLGVVLAGALGIAAGRGETILLPLTATMVLWINLVTDSFPALAVGVDPLDRTLMRRAPRFASEGVISRRMWIGIGVAAVVMAAGTLALLDAGLPGGMFEGEGDTRHARTLAFNALVLFQLFDVLCIRSDEDSVLVGLFSNAWLWASIAGAVMLQVAVIHVPAMQQAFGTTALSAGDWALSAAVASTIVVARELLKAVFRRADRRAGHVPSGKLAP